MKGNRNENIRGKMPFSQKPENKMKAEVDKRKQSRKRESFFRKSEAAENIRLKIE